VQLALLKGIEGLQGGAGADLLTGDAGANVLGGGGGKDRLNGAGGNDTLLGGAGDDKLDGGAGEDTVSFAGLATPVSIELQTGKATGEGSDQLMHVEHAIGGEGADTITGSNKGEMIAGGGGGDRLSGEKGDDILQGDAGADTLTGGRGADIFVFDDLDTATDHVTDLEAGDVIDLSAIDANGADAGDGAFTLVGSFSGAGAEMTLTYNGVGTTTLAMDRDGDSVADLLITMAGNQSGFTDFVY
jgi:serralysin